MTTPSSEDKTVAEAMRLVDRHVRSWSDVTIGTAASRHDIESFLRTALAASGSKESPRPFDGLTDAEVDSIFEPLQDAPTMQFRYLAAEGITAALAMKWGAAPVEQSAAMPEPIDMVLHCPKCGKQHIDAREPAEFEAWEPEGVTQVSEGWDNPPHRSHLCHGCGHIWRPADVPTNGVAAVQTKGKDDSPSVEQR